MHLCLYFDPYLAKWSEVWCSPVTLHTWDPRLSKELHIFFFYKSHPFWIFPYCMNGGMALVYLNCSFLSLSLPTMCNLDLVTWVCDMTTLPRFMGNIFAMCLASPHVNPSLSFLIFFKIFIILSPFLLYEFPPSHSLLFYNMDS